MKNFWLIILFFTVSGATVFAQTLSGESRTQDKSNSDTEKVDRLFAQWNKPDSPGCSLAIIKDGKIIYEKGYGIADLEHDIPISPQTVFNTGSVAKQFTALAVTMLAQQGKLSLDDDIRKFLPEMPSYKTPIIVRHLLWHTSGLREQQDLLWLAGWRREDLQTESDILAFAARQKELNFNPGEEYSYSNTNYNLLSVIVSRVSKQNFADYVKTNIFAPLGMNRTLVKSDSALIIKNRAIAYLPRYEGGLANSTFSYESSGAGNLNTTVEDMALWDQNFYSKAVGGNALEQMLVSGTLNDGTKTGYGFGINIGSYKGFKTIGHGGADPGYLADWIQFPEQKFSVVCFCNTFGGGLNPAALTRQIADIYLADKFVQSSGTNNNSAGETIQRVPISEQQLAKTIGLYLSAVDGATLRRLIVKDGKLFYSRAAGNESELIPIGENRFRMVTTSKIEVVIKHGQGKQRGQMLLFVDEQKPLVYESVSEASYLPKQLTEFAGNYYSDELDTYYKIVAEGEKLIVKTNKTDFIPPLIAKFSDGFADEAGFGVTVRFVRDKSNRVTGFLINRGRIKKLRFSKLSK